MRFFEAKSYGLHETSNPLFPRAPQKRRWWPIVTVILFLALSIAGLGVAVYGPYFNLTAVTIDGVVTLKVDDIRFQVEQEFANNNWLILPNRHQWFFNTKKAEADLSEHFPLASVQVTREGSTVHVTLVEDVFMVAFRSGEAVYFLDPTGIVLREATPEEKAAVLVKVGAVAAPADSQTILATLQADMPVLKDKTGAVYAPGDLVFSELKLDNILTFNAGLKNQGIYVHEFVSDDVQVPWFSITSDQDYLILFDAAKDPAEQLEVLAAVRQEYLTDTKHPSYIDVRFGTRVYVK